MRQYLAGNGRPGGAVGLRGRDVSVLSEVDGALAALLGNPRDLAGPPTVVVGKYPRPNSIANLYPARRPSTTRATTSPGVGMLATRRTTSTAGCAAHQHCRGGWLW